jgi:hypothetical protein
LHPQFPYYVYYRRQKICDGYARIETIDNGNGAIAFPGWVEFSDDDSKRNMEIVDAKKIQQKREARKTEKRNSKKYITFKKKECEQCKKVYSPETDEDKYCGYTCGENAKTDRYNDRKWAQEKKKLAEDRDAILAAFKKDPKNAEIYANIRNKQEENARKVLDRREIRKQENSYTEIGTNFDIENEIGVQKINSVGDCDNLITVNCIDQCGKIYGDKLGLGQLPFRDTFVSYGTFNALFRHTYDYMMSNVCRANTISNYYAQVNDDIGDYYVIAFLSQSECTQECGQFVVGSRWQMGGSFITSKDCSCGSLPLCSCDATTTSAPERRVTNFATCKTYFENKDAAWQTSHPIKQCDGTLKEVEECKDMITLIGTFGGYVSLIYSAVGFLFFIAISKARFTKLEKKVNKNSEDIEAEMTSFNNNSDNGTYLITRQNDEYSNEDNDDEDSNDDNDEDNDDDQDDINLSLVAMEAESKDQILGIIDEVAKTFKEILTLSERRIARLRKGESLVARSEKRLFDPSTFVICLFRPYI